MHINDSDRWAWRLGVSVLGETTYLGATTSSKCKDFCTQFIEHLRLSGYVGNPSVTNDQFEIKSLYEEDIWAWTQHHRTNQPILDIYAEWVKRRRKACRTNKLGGEGEFYERFQKIIFSDQLENIEPE